MAISSTLMFRSAPRSIHALLLVLAVIAACLVIPASAHALDQIEVIEGRLTVDTADDESLMTGVNHYLRIQYSGAPPSGYLVFESNGYPMPPTGPGCTSTPNGIIDGVTCDFFPAGSAVQSKGAAIYAGYGDDTVDTQPGMAVDEPLYIDGEQGIDTLTGGDGNDTIRGGEGADTLVGGEGDDIILARGDGSIEQYISCGGGTDTVYIDANEVASVDAEWGGCENVLTSDAPGGSVPPPNPPTPDPVTPTPDPGTTTPPPATGGGTVPEQIIPGTLLGGVRFETIIDTGRTVTIPDLRGKDVLTAFLILQKAGINFDLQPYPLNKLRKQLPTSIKPAAKWDDGDIIVQEKATVLLSGSRSTVNIVVRYWEGPTAETCAQELKEFIGLPYSQFEEIAKREKCKVDDTRMAIVKTTKKPGEIDRYSGDRCELGAVNGTGKVVDTTLNIPRNPALQDLRIVVLAGYKGLNRGPGPSLKDWSYIAGSNNNHLFLKILTRTGQPVDGAVITLDTAATWPKGVQADPQQQFKSLTQVNFGGGIVDHEFRTGRKAGMILIGARVTDTKGHSLCGAAEVPAKLIGSGKGNIPVKGDYFNTAAGRSYVFASNGRWAGAGAAKPVSQLPPAGRAARAEGRGFLENLLSLFSSIFTGSHSVPTKGQTVNGMTNSNIVLGQLALGQPLKANAPAAQIVSGGAGNIVGIGGGNIVSGGAGNIVSNDGATIVSGGGGNIVSGGAGNLIMGFDGAKIVSGGGGNIVSGGGGNIRSDTLNMNKAQVIGMDGAGIVSNDGATAIAATGAGAMAAGGQIVSGGAGNIVSGGAGN